MSLFGSRAFGVYQLTLQPANPALEAIHACPGCGHLVLVLRDLRPKCRSLFLGGPGGSGALASQLLCALLCCSCARLQIRCRSPGALEQLSLSLKGAAGLTQFLLESRTCLRCDPEGVFQLAPLASDVLDLALVFAGGLLVSLGPLAFLAKLQPHGLELLLCLVGHRCRGLLQLGLEL